MTDSRQILGKSAECRAEEWFLTQRPSRLLAKNYRCRTGEIELIFEDIRDSKKTLVFVEVRARSKKCEMGGAPSINWKKQRSLSKAIQYFLLNYKGPEMDLRVDLLYWDGSTWMHMPNIWLLDSF